MNDECYKRYKKTKELNCLYSIRKNQKYLFLVSGSGDSRYTVTIESKWVRCTCPDFKHNTKKLECLCKHCILILNRTLKLFSVNHDFWKRRFFTPDEIAQLKESYRVNKVKSKNAITDNSKRGTLKS